MANVGENKDSLKRQKEAVHSFAEHRGHKIVAEYYDRGVSGADDIITRPAFNEMLVYAENHNIKMILVETASRFARDLLVQITGHNLLKFRGIELVPVDAPDYFTEDTPTAQLVRGVLGLVSQFEKQTLTERLRVARNRVIKERGQCGGRQAIPQRILDKVAILKSPWTSYAEVSRKLAEMGEFAVDGKPYRAISLRRAHERQLKRSEIVG